MNDAQFAEILALPYEQRSIEFKGPGELKDKFLFPKVMRAVLGMANNRDGGLIVIGVDDSSGTPVPLGVSDAELATWRNRDYVADQFALYSDPSVTFDLSFPESGGKKFVLISVAEFDDIPVLCRRDLGTNLRQGACYVRTRRKPETMEIPTQAEMRDLLDLAIRKGVARFVSQAREAGMSFSAEAVVRDSGRFEAELAGLGMRVV